MHVNHLSGCLGFFHLELSLSRKKKGLKNWGSFWLFFCFTLCFTAFLFILSFLPTLISSSRYLWGMDFWIFFSFTLFVCFLRGSDCDWALLYLRWNLVKGGKGKNKIEGYGMDGRSFSFLFFFFKPRGNFTGNVVQ